MARLQIAPLPHVSADFLLVIDLVEAAQLDVWRSGVAQLKADTDAVGVIVTTDRLDLVSSSASAASGSP